MFRTTYIGSLVTHTHADTLHLTISRPFDCKKLLAPTIMVVCLPLTSPTTAATCLPTTSTFWSKEVPSRAHHLHEFWIDLLIGFSQNINQVLGLLHVVWCEECVCSARVGSSGSAANTVNIVLRTRRVVEVYDKLHILHIMFLHTPAGTMNLEPQGITYRWRKPPPCYHWSSEHTSAVVLHFSNAPTL